MSRAAAAAPLSRERILETALDLARREGPDALSMRRVAAELGTGPMSLYNHVPNKDALIDGITELLLERVGEPAGGDWREVATSWAHSVRTTLLRNRPVLPQILVRPESLVLGLAASSSKALAAVGLDGEQAFRVTRIVSRYVTGSIAIEGAVLSRGLVARKEVDEIFADGLEALLDGLAAKLRA